MVHMLQSADEDYPCTMCGNATFSQVRGGADPRLKCGRCNYIYSASDSKAAKDAGSIPDGLPELQEPTEAASNPREPVRKKTVTLEGSTTVAKKIPRSPKFVVVSKDRTSMEFTTNKDLKKVILRWVADDKKYDVFELTPKSVSAKIDIS